MSAGDAESLAADGDRPLVIKTQPLAKPSEEELHQAMLNGIREKGLACSTGRQRLSSCACGYTVRRSGCRKRRGPQDDASLLASLEMAAAADERRSFLRALKALDLRQALQDWLPWPLRQKLDRELPTHYTVPTGSRIAIRYHAENPPALAVRMQEMFGEATTPVIAEGRVPLVLELLSPAQRPLQITRDLERLLAGATARCKRDEGTLSEARLAGRSGQRRPDPPQQKYS
jgi:ATP-dependent helicase HrpB